MNSPSQSAIKIEKLSKIYKIYRSPVDRLLENISGKRRHVETIALKEVSFTIEKGTAVGIIGRNGSGKSTLLKILASIIEPTSGVIEVKGKVSGILDLTAGFMPEFSGIDNIRLNAKLLGMNEKEINKKLDAILEFAGVGAYTELAVKTYSAGMLLRLGFAIAQSVEADIFLVDEVLAVGDASFQKKCIKKMNEFRANGATIILVTHSLADLGGFCNRVIQLDEGRVVQDGPTEKVLQKYLEDVRDRPDKSGAPLVEYFSPYRERSKDIVIEKVELLTKDGIQIEKITTGAPLVVRIKYRVNKAVHNPLFRVQFFNEQGGLVHGTNTYRHNLVLGDLNGEGIIELIYDSFMLLNGRYYLTVGVYPDEFALALADRAYDVHTLAYSIDVESERIQGAGVVSMNHRWVQVK